MTSALFCLSNRVVALTGGYGWLGAAVSRGLAAHGAHVFILGREEEKFRAVLGDEARIEFQECDVERSHSIEIAFENVVSCAGGLDVVINNAFYCRGADPEAISDDDWAYSLDGTLGTVHRCIRASIPLLRRRGGGKIINVGSMYGVVAPAFSIYDAFPQQRNPPHYGAAKAAVIQLTRYYAALLGPDKINVNCISPGPFPAQRAHENRAFVDALAARVPLGRIGRPEELQGPFVFLSSHASDYVTGHNLIVDGGWTIW